MKAWRIRYEGMEQLATLRVAVTTACHTSTRASASNRAATSFSLLRTFLSTANCTATSMFLTSGWTSLITEWIYFLFLGEGFHQLRERTAERRLFQAAQEAQGVLRSRAVVGDCVYQIGNHLAEHSNYKF